MGVDEVIEMASKVKALQAEEEAISDSEAEDMPDVTDPETELKAASTDKAAESGGKDGGGDLFEDDSDSETESTVVNV